MWALGLAAIGTVASATVWRLRHPVGKTATSAASVASSGATDPASKTPMPAGASVKPHFAWPLGKLGRLQVTQIRERTGVPPAEAAAQYDISVSALPDGNLRISYGSPKPLTKPGQPPPQPIDLLNPPLVVSKDGKLVGIDDNEAYVAQMVDAVGNPPGAPPKEQLAALMATVAQARAHNGWDSLVTSWSGRTLPVKGETKTLITDLPPVPDAAPLRVTTTIRTLGFQPCRATPGSPQCLKIESVGHPEAGSVELLSKALQQQARGQDVGIQFKSLEIRVSLLTEPSTLLPHRHELQRRFTVELTQGGNTQEVIQIERQIQEFTY